MTDAKSIPKAYDPVAVEKKWYGWWEEQGFFRAKIDADVVGKQALYSLKQLHLKIM